MRVSIETAQIDTAQIETAVEVEFDRFARSYDQLLRDPLRTGFASDPLHFWQRKWNVLRGLLDDRNLQANSMSWLDVGCGRGELLDLAGSQFHRVAGCDPSAAMLARDRRFPMHKQPHPTQLPFPSRAFDLVTAVCVYHHVAPEARTALTREIQRVLRPGGHFCLIEHNPYNPVTRQIVNRCPVDFDAVLLSLNESVNLLCASGLRPCASEYFLYLPEKWFRKFGWTERVLARIPFGGQYALLGQADPHPACRPPAPCRAFRAWRLAPRAVTSTGAKSELLDRWSSLSEVDPVRASPR